MKITTLYILAISALLAPITEMLADAFKTNFALLLVVGVFVFVDTFTGVIANWYTKTSGVFWEKTSKKLAAYMGIIIVGFTVFTLTQTVEAYKLEIGKAEKIITYVLTVIMIREFWSVFENVDKLVPGLGSGIKNHLQRILKIKQ